MDRNDLTGKLVLVTEGTRDVGKAIAERFVQRGAQVITNASHCIDGSKGNAPETRALAPPVEAIRASLAQKHQIEHIFEEIEAKHGRLDILVNNSLWNSLLVGGSIPEEHFLHAIDTYLNGTFWYSRRAAALMARAGGGAIVNVSSPGATPAPATKLLFETSKTVLESFTRYLAIEYAPQQIRVNTASAMQVEDGMAAKFSDSENIKGSSSAASVLARPASAGGIADLVLFLASDAARWITGQVIVADGGLSLCVNGQRSLPEWVATTPPVSQAPSLTTEPGTSTRPTAYGFGAKLPDTDEIAVLGVAMALARSKRSQRIRRALLDWKARFAPVIKVPYISRYGRMPPQDKYAEAVTDFSALMQQLPERCCEELVARQRRPCPPRRYH
jgi:NAD(P)-dependent dehydrogenase (short-subunit alcohol dehydrogenase family)